MLFVGQQMASQKNCIQRIAKLVGNRGEEVVLQPIRVFRAGQRAFQIRTRAHDLPPSEVAQGSRQQNREQRNEREDRTLLFCASLVPLLEQSALGRDHLVENRA